MNWFKSFWLVCTDKKVIISEKILFYPNTFFCSPSLQDERETHFENDLFSPRCSATFSPRWTGQERRADHCSNYHKCETHESLKKRDCSGRLKLESEFMVTSQGSQAKVFSTVTVMADLREFKGKVEDNQTRACSVVTVKDDLQARVTGNNQSNECLKWSSMP